VHMRARQASHPVRKDNDTSAFHNRVGSKKIGCSPLDRLRAPPPGALMADSPRVWRAVINPHTAGHKQPGAEHPYIFWGLGKLLPGEGCYECNSNPTSSPGSVFWLTF
jgi:hypothetical protein